MISAASIAQREKKKIKRELGGTWSKKTKGVSFAVAWWSLSGQVDISTSSSPAADCGTEGAGGGLVVGLGLIFELRSRVSKTSWWSLKRAVSDEREREGSKWQWSWSSSSKISTPDSKEAIKTSKSTDRLVLRFVEEEDRSWSNSLGNLWTMWAIYQFRNRSSSSTIRWRLDCNRSICRLAAGRAWNSGGRLKSGGVSR